VFFSIGIRAYKRLRDFKVACALVPASITNDIEVKRKFSFHNRYFYSFSIFDTDESYLWSSNPATTESLNKECKGALCFCDRDSQRGTILQWLLRHEFPKSKVFFMRTAASYLTASMHRQYTPTPSS